MLKITIPKVEIFDNEKQEFIEAVKKDTVIKLEHSLISLQKWEAIHHKAFLSKRPKTRQETIDYIKCMCLHEVDDDKIFDYIPTKELDRVAGYIENPMSATVFAEDTLSENKYIKKKDEILTAEKIYYWMIALNIPQEFKKWHLNQLINLIKLVSLENERINNKGKRRRSDSEILRDYDRINEMRRKQLNTKG